MSSLAGLSLKQLSHDMMQALRVHVEEKDQISKVLSDLPDPETQLALVWQWICMLYEYKQVFDSSIAPKIALFDAATQEKQELEREKAENEELIAKLKVELASVSERYESLTIQISELSRDIDANALVQKSCCEFLSDLSRQVSHWKAALTKIESSMKSCVGQSLLASALVSYTGLLSDKVRRRYLEDECKEKMGLLNIKYEQDKPVLEMLIQPADYEKYFVEGWAGMDVDNRYPWALQNVCIAEKSSRFPVLIDPDLLTVTWLAKVEQEGKGVVIKDVEYLKKTQAVKNCVASGQTLVIKSNEARLDGSLRRILLKNTVKKAKTTFLDAGFEWVEYHPSFHLLLTTTAHDFDVSSAAHANCISFEAGEGHIAQLLLEQELLIREERLFHEFQQISYSSISSWSEYSSLQSEVLFQTQFLQAFLLSDADHISSARNEYLRLDRMNRRIEQHEEGMAQVKEKLRAHLRPVRLVASTWLLIKKFQELDGSYQFSLNLFLRVMKHFLTGRGGLDPLAQRRLLLDKIVYYLLPGLHEQHRLHFLLSFYFMTEIASGNMSSDFCHRYIFNQPDEQDTASLIDLSFNKLAQVAMQQQSGACALECMKENEMKLMEHASSCEDLQRHIVASLVDEDVTTSEHLNDFFKQHLQDFLLFEANDAKSKPQPLLVSLLCSSAEEVDDFIYMHRITDLGRQLSKQFVSLSATSESFANKLQEALRRGDWVLVRDLHLEEVVQHTFCDYVLELHSQPSASSSSVLFVELLAMTSRLHLILRNSIKMRNFHQPQGIRARYDRYQLVGLQDGGPRAEKSQQKYLLLLHAVLVAFQGLIRRSESCAVSSCSFDTQDLQQAPLLLESAARQIPLLKLADLMYGYKVDASTSQALQGLWKMILSRNEDGEEKEEEEEEEEVRRLDSLARKFEESLSGQQERVSSSVGELEEAWRRSAGSFRDMVVEKVTSIRDMLPLATIDHDNLLGEMTYAGTDRMLLLHAIATECAILNRLRSEMARNFDILDKVIMRSGLLSTSAAENALRLAEELLQDRVPAHWIRSSFPSYKSLGPWLRNLNLRIEQCKRWAEKPPELLQQISLNVLCRPASFIGALAITRNLKVWKEDKVVLQCCLADDNDNDDDDDDDDEEEEENEQEEELIEIDGLELDVLGWDEGFSLESIERSLPPLALSAWEEESCCDDVILPVFQGLRDPWGPMCFVSLRRKWQPEDKIVQAVLALASIHTENA
eukprot:745686-Hanusia_phi.AAC.7